MDTPGIERSIIGDASPTPEMALLLWCVRFERGYGPTREPSACVSGVDWDRFEALVQYHKVLPLVYRALRRECPDLVPEPALQGMAEAYHQNQVLSRVMTREMLRIIGELEAAGVPAIPLRGPALAEAVYGDPRARQFCDIDILIRRPDLRACEAALCKEGYSTVWPWPLDSRAGRLLADRGKSLVLAYRTHTWELDVHWRFAMPCFPCPPDPDEVWGRATSSTLEGREVGLLSPEDLVLTAACHGAIHAWQSVALAVDLVETVRAHPDVRWEHIREEFRRFHCVRIFHVALLAAQLVAEVPVPGALIEEALRNDSAMELTQGIWRRILVQGDMPDAQEAPIFCYHVRDRLRDRLRYALGFATFPSFHDWRLIRVPPWLVGTYSVIRPLRLARVFGSLARRSAHTAL